MVIDKILTGLTEYGIMKSTEGKSNCTTAMQNGGYADGTSYACPLRSTITDHRRRIEAGRRPFDPGKDGNTDDTLETNAFYVLMSHIVYCSCFDDGQCC